jgi:hypothetical protein
VEEGLKGLWIEDSLSWWVVVFALLLVPLSLVLRRLDEAAHR